MCFMIVSSKLHIETRFLKVTIIFYVQTIVLFPLKRLVINLRMVLVHTFCIGGYFFFLKKPNTNKQLKIETPLDKVDLKIDNDPKLIFLNDIALKFATFLIFF